MNLNDIAHQSKGEETDTQRHHYLQCMNIRMHPQRLNQLGKRINEKIQILEIDQYPHAQDDSQRRQQRIHPFRLGFADGNAQKIKDHRCYDQQRQHFQIGIAIKEIAGHQQRDILDPGSTFQQYIVQDKYRSKKENELDGIEKHSTLSSFQYNQSSRFYHR